MIRAVAETLRVHLIDHGQGAAAALGLASFEAKVLEIRKAWEEKQKAKEEAMKNG